MYYLVPPLLLHGYIICLEGGQGQLEHDELTLGDAVADQVGAHHADLQ